MLSLPTPLLLSSSPSPISSPSLYNMSQHSQINYSRNNLQHYRHKFKPCVANRLAAQAEGAISRVGKVAKSQMFDKSSEKVSGFMTVYKLYIRMKMRGVAVRKQIQWILSYVQEGLADV